jgi:UDP-GlcNAc:undecaprenyl-phosphate GlcNAc-1-phosphate transferase
MEYALNTVGIAWVVGGTTLFVFFFYWLFGRLGILDKPWPDVPQRDRVPTLQGIPLLLAIFVLIAILVPQTEFWVYGSAFFGFFIGTVLIGVLSVIDELWRLVHQRYRISAKVRLLAQTLAAAWAFWVSGVGFTVLDLPWGLVIPLWPLSQVFLTIARFWLFCNAINWFDGVYAQATWMSTLWFLTISVLVGVVVFAAYPAMSPGQATLLQHIVLVSAICAWVWLLYTVMEYKPWWVVRDVGTMSLGFMLAYLTLLWGAKIGTLIVVLALPVFDAMWVIVDRIKKHKNPLKGDYSHLHFRLMALGWNRHEIRVVVWWISLCMMILMLLQWVDRAWKIVIFCMLAVVFFGINAYLFWWKKLPSEYVPPRLRG